MKIVLIQFVVWEKPTYYSCDDFDLKIGNYVVVDTKNGIDLGKVIALEDKTELHEVVSKVIRKATKEDLDKALALKKEKQKTVKTCKRLVEKYNLPLKLIDAHYSIDDTRLTFAFIANGRIDFRELLKDLIKKFKKNIRLQQIGVRDEAKMCGDFGFCGRPLCCARFDKEIDSITSDLAELQQVAHRGAERLSGVCGRLKCCLSYERKCYEECAAKLPAIGTKVRTDKGRGKIVGWHILKKSVDVLLEDQETVIEVPIKD